MFFFKINNTEYKVFFQHEKEEIKVRKLKIKNGIDTGEFKIVEHPYETQCNIVKVDTNDQEVIGAGLARCSNKDQFSYVYGRKLSLKRAIIDSKIPKEERNIIWSTYFDKHKQ